MINVQLFIDRKPTNNTSTIIRSLIVFISFSISSFSYSQSTISKGIFLGKSKPLIEVGLKQTKDILPSKKKGKEQYKEIPNFQNEFLIPQKYKDTALPKNGDPLVQKNRSGDHVLYGNIDIDLIIEGQNQSQSGGVLPPDTEGDSGKNYFIQATNGNGSTIRIYNKSGDLAAPPMNLNGFWSEFGAQGLGDPIIMYDHDAERWVLTEFETQVDNALLVAVSVTDDPLGEYYAYKFRTPDFPDYPKYGVWPDAYYVTSNEFSDPFVPIYIIDRESLLNGEDTDIIRLSGMDKYNISNGFQLPVSQRATPAEWDGTLPPPEGTPHYNFRVYDDAWGSGQDKIEMWEAIYDKENPSNSRLEGPIDIFLEPFDTHLCLTSTRDCIAQPGTDNLVAVIPYVIQNRVQYRNFGTHEMMLLNFPVDINDTNTAGVRWVELRRENGNDWYKYQEGTYAPDDASRFMAGIGMDGDGNIALGYTKVDTDSTFLSLYVTGRLAGDSLGVFTFEETLIAEGGSANNDVRWGDYSSMSIDPLDEKTFWYTGEYMLGNNRWSTKIGRFQIFKDTIDLAPIELQEPTTSPDLGVSEMVTVQIKNKGLTEQSLYSIGLIVDGNLIVEDPINQLLPISDIYTHTYSIPIDMYEIRDYHFEVYTILANDDNMSNDTSSYIRTKLPKYDAGVVNVNTITDIVCGDTLGITVDVQNFGEEILNNFILEITLNGSSFLFPQEVFLNKGDIHSIDLPLFDFIMNENQFSASILSPNGIDDENMANDEWTKNFTFNQDARRLEFDMNSDFYSNETSWLLIDMAGDTIDSRAYLKNGGASENVYYCLDEGCYTFILKDSYGDGWESGSGIFYEWKDESGNILATLIESNFGFEQVYDFCIPFECMLDATVSIEDSSEENVADGTIFVSPTSGIPPFSYSIDGQNFQSESIFEDLVTGDYTVTIIDANGCEIEELVTVDFILSSNNHLADKINVVIAPNPNEGRFDIKVEGLGYLTELTATLYSELGQPIYEKILANYSGIWSSNFSLKQQKEGVYFLRLNTKESNKVYKIIKAVN